MDSGAATLFIKIKYGHVLIVPWGLGGSHRVLDNVHNVVGFFYDFSGGMNSLSLFNRDKYSSNQPLLSPQFFFAHSTMETKRN